MKSGAKDCPASDGIGVFLTIIHSAHAHHWGHESGLFSACENRSLQGGRMMKKLRIWLCVLLVGFLVAVQGGPGECSDLQPAKPTVKPRTEGRTLQPGLLKVVDLAVVPGSLMWKIPPVAGRRVQPACFQFTVRNIGSAEVMPFFMNFTCTAVSPGGGSCPGKMSGKLSMGVMDAAGGANPQITDYWPPPPDPGDPWQPGTYEIKVEANADRKIRELNFSNNVQTLRFTVTKPFVAPKAPASRAGTDPKAPVEVKGINPQPEPP